MLPCLVPVLFAFYLQGVLKFKCKFRLQKVNSGVDNTDPKPAVQGAQWAIRAPKRTEYWIWGGGAALLTEVSILDPCYDI